MERNKFIYWKTITLKRFLKYSNIPEEDKELMREVLIIREKWITNKSIENSAVPTENLPLVN